MTLRSFAVRPKSRCTRTLLMMSAATVFLPGVAYAQVATDVPLATTRSTTITIGGTDTVTVEGSLAVTGATPRAINYNANGSGAGPTITNSGSITNTSTGTPRAIATVGDFANRSITIINNSGAIISAATNAIQITNTASNAATGSVITVTNSGMITSSSGASIEVSAMSGATLNVTNNVGGTITGLQGITNDSMATVINNGTIRGIGNGGATSTGGEGIRLTGNGTNTVTLGAMSITQAMPANANVAAPNAVAFTGTGANTVNLTAGAQVLGTNSMGAAIAGRLKASSTGANDVLNLIGTGNGTLVLSVDFETLNVNSGNWLSSSASTKFTGTATVANGATLDAGTTGGLAAGTIIVNNGGTITSSTGIAAQNITTTGLSLTNNGTITGAQAIFSDAAATIVNNGTLTGTSGTGEALRLIGNGTNTVTLGAASVTQNTSTTATTPNAIFFFGTGANTLNIAGGAQFGRLKGSANSTNDVLNLNGPGGSNLGFAVDFETLNVNGGTWSLNAANVIGGTTTIAAGAVLRYVDAASVGGLITSGTFINNGQLENARTNLALQTTAISGTGSVRVTGTGTFEFAAANTYSGATLIENGRISTDIDNALSAASAVTISAPAILSLNDGATDAMGNPTPGAHSQTIANLSGAGTVRLGQLQAATLTTGAAGGNTTFSGVLAQLGNLTKVGSGTLTLSGANTATGLLRASGGGIALSGSFAGSGQFDVGTTLSGGGSIAGSVTVNGTIAPGNGGIGTFSTGALALSASSILAFDVGANQTSDRISVNGDLTLDGTLNLNDVGGFGQGVYRLIDYTGALSDNGLTIGTTPFGTDNSQVSIQTAISTQVNLIYGAVTAAQIQFWDGASGIANGSIDGGPGSWNLGSPSWTSADGTANTAWAGNFAVFQGTPGIVTVDGAIGFNGAQFISDGYVIAAGSGALSASATLTNVRADAGITGTISAGIGGTGGLIKNDSGTVILSGTNSYAGATNIAGGTLRVTGGSAIPVTSAVTIQAAGTLELTSAQAIGSLSGAGTVMLTQGTLTTGGLNTSTTFSGLISGTGNLLKAGTGTFTLAGTNSYTGVTNVNAGTLTQGASGALGSGRLIVLAAGTVNLGGFNAAVESLSGAGRLQFGTGGSLLLTGATTTTFSGDFTGTGALTRDGTGTLILSGATGGLTGGVVVNGGILEVANAGAIANATTVAVNSGGTFQIDVDKTIGALSGAGSVALGANRLTVSSGQATTFAGVATGTGGITKAGTGSLTLSGTNLYTADTTATAGTLLVTGAVAGTASAVSGATLGGTGTIAGVLSIADGATLAPGANGVGTLTTGGLLLSGNSILAYDLGMANVAGVSDRVQVNGNLTLDGRLNIADAGGFGTGVYRLIDYTGTLTNSVLTVNTLPNGFAVGQTQIQTSMAGHVNLVVAGSLPEIQFWDGADTAGNNRVDGGSGSWTNTATNWTSAAGDFNSPWGGRFAVFLGTAGTVTVDDAITFTGMQFTSNYTIAAGTGALSATTVSNIRVDTGVTATIGASIGGTGGIAKADAGTLILSGTNGYTGATVINGGVLRTTGANSISAASAVSVASGATLDIATSQTIGSLAGPGSVTLSGGSLTAGGSGGSTVFDGVLSGAGSLTKAGAGTMTIGGANTYAGGTAITGGTLLLSGSGRLGAGNLAISAGAAFDLGNGSSSVAALSGTGTVALGSGVLTAGGVTDSLFGGAITGTGGLTKAGSGNLTLSGTGSYTGTTTVAAGTLTIGSTTATSAGGAVAVNAGATLALGVSKTIGSLSGAGSVALGTNTLTVLSGGFSGVVAGMGGLTKASAGTLTLSGVNSYTGATTISAGTLALGAGGSIAASSGVNLSGTTSILDISAGGAQSIAALSGVAGSSVVLGANILTQTNALAATFSGVISGSGGFTKAGAGTLTLAGVNTYTGATTVNAGILRSGIANAFGPGALVIASGASVNLGGFAQGVSSISGAGGITLGAATLSITGAESTAYSGIISGTGALTKTSTGTLILSGANTYTGATTLNGGLLTVNGSLASAVTLGANGRLGGDGSVGALTINGTVAPGNSIGTLNVNGGLTFAAGSTYAVETAPGGTADLIAATGAVTINGGTVAVTAGGSGYAPSTTYTILTAGTTVTGMFAGTTSNLAFLTPSLSYSANAVMLRLVRNDVLFTDVARTPNQNAVGAALQLRGTGVLYNAVVGLSAAGTQTFFDALSGEVHADTLTIANRDAQGVQRPLLDRLASIDGDGVGIWLQGASSRGDVDSSGGYAGVDLRRTGVLGGIDFSRNGVHIGVSGGYSTTKADVDDRLSRARITNSQFAIYGGLSAGNVRIRAGAGYVHHDVNTDRTVATAGISDATSASYGGDTLHGFGEIGYSIGNTGFSVEPFGGIAYARTRLDAFTEFGGVTALAVEADSAASMLATAGVRFGGADLFGHGTRLDAELAARHYIDDGRGQRRVSFAGTNQSFVVTSADFGRTGGIARLGISVPVFASGWIGASGEGDFSKESSDYGGRVKFGWRF